MYIYNLCVETYPSGMFAHFLKRTAEVMALRLSIVFQQLVGVGSFPACWCNGKFGEAVKFPIWS